jgi:hypothetical protein
MGTKSKAVNKKLSIFCILFAFVLVGSASVFADITYSLIITGDWTPDVQNRISSAMSEAVGLYNQYGSFNMHINVEYHPAVPTAEANYGGYLKFGGTIGTRVALHEMAHTVGCGTYWDWGNHMSGAWNGAYATAKIKEFDGPGALLYGDKWHFWPYGLNYDNEDGVTNRIRHINIAAGLVSDMGLFSFVKEPASQTVLPGTTVVFSTDAPIAGSYAWYKKGNSNPLTNGGDISGANTNTLRIANADINDEGRYYCVASAGNSTLDSRTASLMIRRFVSHWKFSDNPYDRVGANHAATTGSPVYAAGKIGRAIDLDGTNDYITLPAGVADTADITVAAWVSWDGGDPWQRIFDFGNNTNQFLVLTPRSGDNTLRFTIKNGGGEQIVETSQLATGQWVHVAVTLSGDTATLYVNGAAAAANGGVTINPNEFLPSINYLGDSQFIADALFNGRIDEFRIYNYALTSAEIQDLYAGVPESPSPAVNTSGVPTQLCLTWDGGVSEENSWQTYLGTSQGAVANATPASAEYLGVRHTEQLSTPTLLPNTAYYWRVDPLVPGGTAAKGRVWMFMTSSTPTGQLGPKFTSYTIAKPDAVEGIAYNQSLSGNVVTAGASSFQKLAGPEWICLSSSGQITGTPPDGTAGQASCIVRIADTAGRTDEALLSLSVRNTYSGMNGLVDLTRFADEWLYAGPVFNAADLDQNQKVDLADWSLFASDWNFVSDPGLVAAWKMDEAIGETILDELGRYPGTLRNVNTSWRPLRTVAGENHCLSLDGTNDYAEITGYKGINGTASRTCSAWIKTSGSTSNTVIVDWGTASADQKWLFGVFSTGELAVYTWPSYIKTNRIVTDNQWHHVAAVLADDGTPNVNEIQLYVDGQLQATTVSSAQAINTAAAADVLLGAYDNAGAKSGYFKGLIDDVRIYDRALNPDEILATAPGEIGLAAEWKLDEYTGTTAKDALGLHDGTLRNTTGVWATGKTGNALTFDGVNDYVEITDYKGITGTASRTCSAWIKTSGSTANMVIMDWGTAVSGQKWLFGIFTTGQLALYTWTPFIQTNISVTDNQWHHVAVVLADDGTPDVSEIQLYVDGLLQATTVSLSQAINTVWAANVLLGACDNAGAKGFYFNGQMDDIRIYTRALPDTEISFMANQ